MFLFVPRTTFILGQKKQQHGGARSEFTLKLGQSKMSHILQPTIATPSLCMLFTLEKSSIQTPMVQEVYFLIWSIQPFGPILYLASSAIAASPLALTATKQTAIKGTLSACNGEHGQECWQEKLFPYPEESTGTASPTTGCSSSDCAAAALVGKTRIGWSPLAWL